MEATIQGNSQDIRFNVMESMRYNIILEMPWLHERNPKIDWVTKMICAIKDAYKIPKQPEMSLPEHKPWDHKISLLKGEQSKWMPLYPMSEDQLKKV